MIMRKKRLENLKNLVRMTHESLSLNELFPRFIAAMIAEGVSEKTIENDHQQLLPLPSSNAGRRVLFHRDFARGFDLSKHFPEGVLSTSN